MKVLAIGASGKMGRGVVSYFARDPEVEILGVLDAQKSALKSLAEQYGAAKVKPHPVDVENSEEMQKIMGQYDVAVVTLPNRRLSYKVMETAIDARLDLVDILEEYHRRPDTDQTEGLTLPRGIRSFDDYGEQLHERAIANDVLILDGMGFARRRRHLHSARPVRWQWHQR